MVEDFRPHIGKNVIETLTMGMYDDSRFIFREYVQNAADQIDVAVEEGILHSISDGEINIQINSTNREIIIHDNATGIKSENVLDFLGDVANSKKEQSQRKGFRGIGRLGGLGYCDKLVFETSYLGESKKSTLTLDSKLLKKIIDNRSDQSGASEVISVITSIESDNEKIDAHYFTVKLLGVPDSVLLNVENVRSYLSMVAPLPYGDEFSFKEDINSFYVENNFSLDEYNITLNNETIYKAYKDNFIVKDEITPLIGLDFFKVYDSSELLGIGWIGFRAESNVTLPLENIERGIRIKKGNITIGGEFTLDKFFNVGRTNRRFIGELHVLSPSLIPNARRDYFNENKSCQNFEKQLKVIFKDENWENEIAQKASNLSRRVKEIEEYITKKKGLEENLIPIKNEAEREEHILDLEKKKEKAISASKTLAKLSDEASKNKNIKKLYTHIVSSKDLSFDPVINIPKIVFDPPTFNKLSENETFVVREIFKIIEKKLSVDDAEELKTEIINRFN